MLMRIPSPLIIPKEKDAVFCNDRGNAIAAMALAFEHYLLQQDDLLAILGLGGSGNRIDNPGHASPTGWYS